MSNKMLISLIIIIIAVGAAAAGYFYWFYTKPLVVSQNSQSQTSTQDSQNQAPAAASGTPSTAANPASDNPACQRNFNSAELAKNANLGPANREVEIDVQGFGKIDVEFYNTDAPKTVENFLRLTDAGYYDCLTFHRVAKDFVIQGGDPTGTGSGGQSAYGAPFADELNPNTQSYKTGYVAGVLAMANSGPNTNGSQFFITLADLSSSLPHNYTIFGHVVSGMDVVSKIGQVPITPQMGPTDGTPVTPVIMQSVKIIK